MKYNKNNKYNKYNKYISILYKFKILLKSIS